MDYILKIPGPLVDRVHFSLAASVVANAEVKGIEKGKSRDLLWERGYVLYLKKLLDAAQLGALKVCDSKGSPGSFDEIIERASENHGMLKVLHPADQGGGVDEVQMYVTALYSRLAHLNEWAAKNLDKFILSDESAPLVVHVNDDLQIPALHLTKPEKCSEQPDGEPPMKYGTNTRSMCSAWIRHMATTMKEDGESIPSLGKRIICVANSRGYRMSRGGEFSTHLIDSATKPSATGNTGGVGITGGTKANPGAGRTKTGRK